MISKRYDHLLRLLLIGETGVGKTCLLCRFATDDFVESHISTIGIDFKMRTIDIDGETVKVQIWDTAGQERFEAITKQFYRRAQGILLVFDICSRKSYESIPKWLEHVRQFADENDINFFEVSAKNRNNVEKPFRDMCKEILKLNNAAEAGSDKDTSILIDNTVQTDTSEDKQTENNVVEAIEKDENSGNWCCSVS